MTIFAWLARIRHADVEAASYIDEMELYWKSVDSSEDEGLKEEIVSRWFKFTASGGLTWLRIGFGRSLIQVSADCCSWGAGER